MVAFAHSFHHFGHYAVADAGLDLDRLGFGVLTIGAVSFVRQHIDRSSRLSFGPWPGPRPCWSARPTRSAGSAFAAAPPAWPAATGSAAGSALAGSASGTDA